MAASALDVTLLHLASLKRPHAGTGRAQAARSAALSSWCRHADAASKLEQQRAAALEAVVAVQALEQQQRPACAPKQQQPSCRVVADIAVLLGACLTPTMRCLQAASPEQPPVLAQASAEAALQCCCTLSQVSVEERMQCCAWAYLP